jgi:hypothetical protein
LVRKNGGRVRFGSSKDSEIVVGLVE